MWIRTLLWAAFYAGFAWINLSVVVRSLRAGVVRAGGAPELAADRARAPGRFWTSMVVRTVLAVLSLVVGAAPAAYILTHPAVQASPAAPPATHA